MKNPDKQYACDKCLNTNIRHFKQDGIKMFQCLDSSCGSIDYRTKAKRIGKEVVQCLNEFNSMQDRIQALGEGPSVELNLVLEEKCTERFGCTLTSGVRRLNVRLMRNIIAFTLPIIEEWEKKTLSEVA